MEVPVVLHTAYLTVAKCNWDGLARGCAKIPPGVLHNHLYFLNNTLREPSVISLWKIDFGSFTTMSSFSFAYFRIKGFIEVPCVAWFKHRSPGTALYFL